MDELKRLFGLDLESQAENYTTRLSDDRSEIKNFGILDRITDVFADGTKEEVRQRAAELVEDKLNKGTSGARSNILDMTSGTQMGLTDDSLKIRPGETEQAYKNRINSTTRTGNAVLNAIATTPGFDPSKVEKGATAGTVAGMQRSIVDEKTNENERKEQGRYDDIQERQTKTEERLATAQENQRLQNERAQAFREHESSENRKERVYNARMERQRQDALRADRKAELLMNREMKTLDRQYMRERDERADARAEKDKRQQSIMLLVKGLSQLGAGFSI